MGKLNDSFKGTFLTMEGPECVGKSTIAPLIAERLRERGYKVTHTREPGGSELAEELRKLVLQERRIDNITELLLMWTSRADHLHNTIVPALKAGHVVVCERFADSSYAFQGAGRGLFAETIALEKMVLRGIQPDYTLFFDIPFEEQKRRLSLRAEKADRIEKQGFEFYEKVFDGYRARFLGNPQRMVRIDALPEEEEVQAATLRWVNATFENLT
jgi:dTMP kinase